MGKLTRYLEKYIMKKILHVISSARGDHSYSKGLSAAIVRKLTAKNIAGEITERDLIRDFPPFIEPASVENLYKNPDALTPEEEQLFSYSHMIVDEIRAADILVIGTPMHNFGISAPLKAWLDQIVRHGISYVYDNNGKRVGLFGGKQVYLAIASGGRQTSNPGSEFIESYLKAVFSAYMGITDVTAFRIEGTVEPGFKENYEEALKELRV